ncbi:MAG: hypothetical protein ACK5L6_11055 [Anaerorhabdus sp.]|uniref:hypothetical protein n=1 Tax=Anaerorhabdus sp. TaxID=1872524 RepID=UPI003A85CFC1
MIFIYKGRGLLVILITAISLIVSKPCADVFVTMKNYVNETGILIGMLLIYSGVFTRTFFLIFPAKQPQHYVAIETGKDIYVKHVDSLYGLDVKYWAYIFIVIGIIVFTISVFF